MKARAKSSISLVFLLLLSGCASPSNTRPSPAANSSATTGSNHSAILVCNSSQLSILLGVEGAAMGSRGVTGMAFKNISVTPCTLKGYPKAQMLNASGKLIPTYVTHGNVFSSSASAPKLIKLAPGAKAEFDLLYEAQTGYGNAVCPTSSKVAFTPPGSKTQLLLSWMIQPYGGGTIQKLRCGEIRISPLYAP